MRKDSEFPRIRTFQYEPHDRHKQAGLGGSEFVLGARRESGWGPRGKAEEHGGRGPAQPQDSGPWCPRTSRRLDPTLVWVPL